MRYPLYLGREGGAVSTHLGAGLSVGDQKVRIDVFDRDPATPGNISEFKVGADSCSKVFPGKNETLVRTAMAVVPLEARKGRNLHVVLKTRRFKQRFCTVTGGIGHEALRIQRPRDQNA